MADLAAPLIFIRVPPKCGGYLVHIIRIFRETTICCTSLTTYFGLDLGLAA